MDDLLPESNDGILQMIIQHDKKHDDAHRRLRAELQLLEGEVDRGLQSLRDGHASNKSELAQIASSPIDVAKIVLTPRVVVTVVAVSITIAGGVWASTSGLRSDVRDILTRMEAQKTASEAANKLQEVQSSMLKTAIDEMRRRQELQQYEIQGLKEAIITGKVRGNGR